MGDGNASKRDRVHGAHLAVLSACVLVLAYALHTSTRAPAREPRAEPRALTPLDALPAGAGFAVTVDLREVRRSALGRILTASGREIPGVGRLDELCGADPTEHVRAIALASPLTTGAWSRDELGVVALGDFDAESVVHCAELIVRRRGGTPARGTIGSFRTLRDRTRPGELALRTGGPVLLGDGAYLREMIDAAEQRVDSVADDPVHTGLRRTIGTRGAVVATWVLPPDWLVRALRTPVVRASPLASVRAAALRAELSPRVVLTGLVGCDSPRSCEQIASALTTLRDRDLSPMLRRELGRDWPGTIRIDARGSRVDLRAELDPAEAAALVEAVIERLSEPAGGATPTPSASAPQLRRSPSAASSAPSN